MNAQTPSLPSPKTWQKRNRQFLLAGLVLFLLLGSASLSFAVHLHAANPHQDCHVQVHRVQVPGFVNPVTATISENGVEVQMAVTLMYSDTCRMNFAEATIDAPANVYEADVSIERAVGPDGGRQYQDSPFRVGLSPSPFDSPYLYSPQSADSACVYVTPSNAPKICTAFV